MDIKINCILLFFIALFHTGFCDTEEDYACMERTQHVKLLCFSISTKTMETMKFFA
ncbi:hypothetical protein BgiBS90_027475, partial [Biomphalaria glabrata]